jgi:hypothetical protein
MSRRARQLVNRLRSARAYGGSLELLETRGPEAFGFRWTLRRGRVWLQAEPKYVRDFNTTHGLPRASGMYEGGQADSVKQRRGILLGYYLRTLDMTNQSEESVRNQLIRLTLAMDEAGHSKIDICFAVKKASLQATLRCERIPLCLGWTAEEKLVFKRSYDMIFRLTGMGELVRMRG